MKIDLQLFASKENEASTQAVDNGVSVQAASGSTTKEAISGKKIIYLYRILEKAKEAVGTVLAFTTENERTKSKDADSTATKDGNIRTPGASEVEITATSLLTKGDTFIDDLEEALDKDKLIEIWEVNLEEPGTTPNEGKYKATYFQGYLTEVDISSNAEDMVEVSLTFGINGSGVKGYATVSKEQEAIASYVFKDTVQES
jgi:TP901-1 family phage major tail protein